jgi:transposase
LRTVPARALDRTLSELARAETRFHLAAETPVVSCYEAGRDGSWLHHALTAHGVRNHVVDSSSIEVSRRQRRTKSDRLDARKVVALTTRLTVLERERTRLLKRGDSPALTQVPRLMQLRAVGVARELASGLMVGAIIGALFMVGLFTVLGAIANTWRRAATRRVR